MTLILKSFNKNKIIVVILFAALISRLVNINQSYWLDEAIGAIVVRNHTISEILFTFPKGDNHPPLYYLMIKVWSMFFGNGELALRSISVILGVLTVWIVYLISELTGSLKGKLVYLPAILLATSPLHIYYSQEARMYPVTAFFAAAAVYHFLKVVNEEKTKNWIWFSIFILLIAATDYVPIFILPVFWLYSLIAKRKREWYIKLIAAHVPLAMFGIFWLPVYLYQSERGSWLMETLPAWKALAGGADIKQAALLWNKFVLGRISLFNKTLYYSLLLLASIPYILTIISALKNRKGHLIIYLWLIVPIVLLYLLSFKVPAFIYFRLIFVLPAFYLVASFGVSSLKKYANYLIAALIMVNLTGWVIYITDPYQQREQWRQAVAFIESEAKENEIVLFENPQPFAPWEYYHSSVVEAKGATDSISSTVKTIDKTTMLVEGKKAVYYFDYLKDLADPNDFVANTLTENGFYETSVFDFIGVGHVRYWVRN